MMVVVSGDCSDMVVAVGGSVQVDVLLLLLSWFGCCCCW